MARESRPKRRSPVPGTVLVIAAGNAMPPGQLIGQIAQRADIVVCADGGAEHARRLRLLPDVIIGDLDSVTEATLGHFRRRGKRTRIIRDNGQENTDLEKALDHCRAAGVRTAIVAGALGGRSDHAAGAIGVVKKYRRPAVVLLDGYGWLMRAPAAFTSGRGELFSVVPVDRCTGVTITNALYPLSRATLAPGVRDGISNRALGGTVRVSVRSGTLLLYRFYRSAGQSTRDAGRLAATILTSAAP